MTKNNNRKEKRKKKKEKENKRENKKKKNTSHLALSAQDRQCYQELLEFYSQAKTTYRNPLFSSLFWCLIFSHLSSPIERAILCKRVHSKGGKESGERAREGGKGREGTRKGTKKEEETADKKRLVLFCCCCAITLSDMCFPPLF